MIFFSLSNLSRLDVKWASIHHGDDLFYKSSHANPHYQLMLVIDGPVYLQVGQEQLTLRSGEFFILKPWQQHWGWKEIGDQACFFWVQFSANHPAIQEMSMISEKMTDFTLIGSPNDLRSIETNEVKLILPQRGMPECRFELVLHFENIIKEMKRPRGYFRVRWVVLLWSILELIADDLIQRSQLDPLTPASFILYRKIVNLLDESFQSDITKKTLEAALDRKHEYICSLFKKYSGMTITTYIHKLRIQSAKYLLQTTSSNVTTIAEKVGYNDLYYFGKVFKKSTGSTPLQFRNAEARGQPGPQ